MAGERLSKLTILASFSPNAYVRGEQTQHVRFLLAGSWLDYTRGGYTSQHQFAVADPSDVGRAYVQQTVDNLLALVKLDIQSRGLPYTVSASRDLGNDVTTNWPQVAFDIEATLYEGQYNLNFADVYTGSPKGWLVTQKLTALGPIVVQQLIEPAGSYGSATGSIFLTVVAGNHDPFTYTWADIGLDGPSRRNLTAGTYLCVVRDQDGVSTTVTCVVPGDAQLQVLVQQTETSITLTVSGGVAPYIVAWDDGSTDLVREQLAPGAYGGLVTDAHGASQRVVVTLLAGRCYFSQNPVRLPLDAGDAYRLDPTSKPSLSFVAQVWVEPVYNSGVYVQAGPDLEQPADAGGRTVFEVQALLDAYVREHLPALDAPLLVNQAQGLFTRFYLKSGEKYGTPPVVAALRTAQVHVVVCGGLSQEVAAAGTWPAYQAAVQPFLTWEPDYQRVLPQQPAYLYYQHVAPAAAVDVWLRVRHTDGTTSQSVVSSFAPSRWEVYALAVGPAARGLTGPEVAGYDVWVADGYGVLRSQVRHFVLERDYYPQQRFLLYSNSLGGANVLAVLGAAKQTLAVAASEAQRPTYDPDLGDVATLDRVGTPTLSLITGPRRRGQVLADQELLFSRRVVLLSGGRSWPGRVAAASFVLRDEAEGLASLSFDFTLPQQRHFSPRLPAVLAGQLVSPVAGGEGPTP